MNNGDWPSTADREGQYGRGLDQRGSDEHAGCAPAVVAPDAGAYSRISPNAAGAKAYEACPMATIRGTTRDRPSLYKLDLGNQWRQRGGIVDAGTEQNNTKQQERDGEPAATRNTTEPAF